MCPIVAGGAKLDVRVARHGADLSVNVLKREATQVVVARQSKLLIQRAYRCCALYIGQVVATSR